MLPLIMAVGAGALVLLAGGIGERTGSELGKSGEDAAKAKPKKAGRRLSPQESFLEGKKAAKAEFDLEQKAKADREAELDAAVAKRMKAAKAAAPKPPADPPGDDEGTTT